MRGSLAAVGVPGIVAGALAIGMLRMGGFELMGLGGGWQPASEWGPGRHPESGCCDW